MSQYRDRSRVTQHDIDRCPHTVDDPIWMLNAPACPHMPAFLCHDGSEPKLSSRRSERQLLCPEALVALNDRILIEDLRVATYIGVLEQERGRRQQVRFDVEIETVPDYALLVRQTKRYVSYADTVHYIQGRAASDEHVELVETWAEDIADFVLQNPLVQSVRVRVLKSEIFEDAAGVGIEIIRHRS